MKSTYLVAVLYFFLFASSSGRSNAISANYRSQTHCTPIDDKNEPIGAREIRQFSMKILIQDAVRVSEDWLSLD